MHIMITKAISSVKVVDEGGGLMEQTPPLLHSQRDAPAMTCEIAKQRETKRGKEE